MLVQFLLLVIAAVLALIASAAPQVGPVHVGWVAVALIAVALAMPVATAG